MRFGVLALAAGLALGQNNYDMSVVDTGYPGVTRVLEHLRWATFAVLEAAVGGSPSIFDCWVW